MIHYFVSQSSLPAGRWFLSRKIGQGPETVIGSVHGYPTRTAALAALDGIRPPQ